MRNITKRVCSLFRFSVDRRIFLIGYGVYGSMQKPATYETSVELIHTASGKVIATNATSLSCDGSKYTYRLMFKELAEILPNTIYTASTTFKVVLLNFSLISLIIHHYICICVINKEHAVLLCFRGHFRIMAQRVCAR